MKSRKNRYLPHLLLLVGAIMTLTACGTFEVRLEYPDRSEPASTELALADVATIKPVTPTPIAAGYVRPTVGPAATAMPVDDYPAPEGLRVAYLQDGNVWQWSTEVRQPKPLTTSGDIGGPVKISGDGEIVAFVRDGELWMVRSDGTDERLLLNSEIMEAMVAKGSEVQFSRFQWVPGTHLMAFNTRIYQSGSWIPNHDLYQIDADTLAETLLLPPGEGGQFHYSPDGKQIAIVTEGDISLVDADGRNRRDKVLTYTPVSRGSLDRFYAEPAWAADSSALMVAIPTPGSPGLQAADAQDQASDLSLAGRPTTIWRLPVDGTPASLVTNINTIPTADPRAVSFSSDLVFMAYAEPKQEPGAFSAEPELWLALNRLGTIDRFGSPGLNTFYGWAPGRRQFASSFGDDARELSILQWSGPAIYRGVLDGASVQDLRWVDSEHYLFVVRRDQEGGTQAESRDLLLGNRLGSSTILASAPDFWHYDFAIPRGVAAR